MGIILYEFLVGCVPFYGDTPEELFSLIINGINLLKTYQNTDGRREERRGGHLPQAAFRNAAFRIQHSKKSRGSTYTSSISNES